jgi:tRNA (cytidine56-2'-O)-methyltransferase
MNITILRLGHRVFRDQRITTHVALTARAFGAQRIIISGEKDDGIIETIEKVNKEFGGEFKAEYVKNWKSILNKSVKEGDLIIHLTMYGLDVEDVKEKIKKEMKNKKVLIIVGGAKVPAEIYQQAHYNIAVGNQPHSEVSSIAILLDRILKRKEFDDGKIKIIPCEKGKNILKN